MLSTRCYYGGGYPSVYGCVQFYMFVQADTIYRVRWGRVELHDNGIFSKFTPSTYLSILFHLLLHASICPQGVKVGGGALPCPALHEVIPPCIPPFSTPSFCIPHRCPPPNLPPTLSPVQHIKGTVAGTCTTFSLLFIPGRQTPSQQPCPSPDLACPTAAAVVEVAPCP